MLLNWKSIAYIPLQHENTHVGPSRWVIPQRKTESFVLGIPTCWYLKRLKFALSPMQMLEFVLSSMQTPKHEQVEYRLRWVSWHWGLHWATQRHFSVEYGLIPII